MSTDIAVPVDPREFDSPEFQRDPFPVYKRLRDNEPIYHDRFHNRWVLTRYEDVDAAFQDNESFDRAVYSPDGPYEFGSSHVFGPNILEYGNSDRHRWPAAGAAPPAESSATTTWSSVQPSCCAATCSRIF